MDKKFLSEEETIAQFGLDAEQFHRLVENGELRALADRGTWKFRRDEVANLIQEGQLTATNPTGEVAGSPIGAGPDDLSYLELDEDALAEGATIVKKSSDLPEDGPVIFKTQEAIVADSDSDVRIADSGDALDVPDSGVVTDASGVLLSDSGIRAPESGVTLRPVDSGISLEGDSSLVLAGSDIDSGLSLGASEPDSGISLVAGDSGIRLDTDSGISLVAGDSGIRLDTDSGIKLEADSGIKLGGTDSDMPMTAKAHAGADETQPEFDVADEEFALGKSEGGDQTMMIDLDDDDSVETLPPTRRPEEQAASLSESFATVAEVDELDIVEDLDASELDVDAIDEDEELAEDVLEASDEAFSVADEGEISEEALSAESAPVVRTAAREPGWGIAAILPVAAVALLLAVNSLMLWDAMSTMWDGNTDSAVSSGIINALAGIGG